MNTHPHLGVDELTAPEVVRAFVLLQQAKKPEEVIHDLRGEAAQLLDPETFPRDVQRRYQELPRTLKPKEN
ncbi:MAG TPA: hypothetical protein DEB30_01580 [Candidatus Peribacter riflensis]|uniref:Uncharacterized protein n=1 Tax=Candidatus Peribacter riflensis TaxID=1735162 RepID=A0A0S1SUX8_9BACT|nr:MAG: hypothetical protein PeribacterA2_1061 [Candidatus Peribacter riflensis]OGJ77965.1 MAG: hypothetical protein A2398_01585 [Candidatus Peribacteria bacterium RIFOXYB1_FULL_57_12]OGJ82188.1 MAG: hypothetical protein A2412_03710 [Candidatus Peribacteria bacterium RIFOXYC1_FULL_58_8]ALM11520.1 MAG: hypothetical protein PeribacterB2_1063 [Candidatus Peribacter riflensis]ALM12622.1 MAG: hypothetical protein PeribacterC2_1062 [Candidatus Peribacter riflensis]